MANPFPTSTRVLEFFYSIDIEYIFGSCKKEGDEKPFAHTQKPTYFQPFINQVLDTQLS